MCQKALNAETGETITNIGQMKAITCGLLVYANGLPADTDIRDELCLCPVNIPTTLVEAGFMVWRNPNGGLPEYLFAAGIPVHEVQ